MQTTGQPLYEKLLTGNFRNIRLIAWGTDWEKTSEYAVLNGLKCIAVHGAAVFKSSWKCELHAGYFLTLASNRKANQRLSLD